MLTLAIALVVVAVVAATAYAVPRLYKEYNQNELLVKQQKMQEQMLSSTETFNPTPHEITPQSGQYL